MKVVIRLGPTMLAAAMLVAAGPMAANGQTGRQTSPDPSPSPRVRLSVGSEAHRDRLRYKFENPSNIDTPFLVPHNFVQTYVGDNVWFASSARYPFLAGFMTTEFGFAPEKRTVASDLDTFFDPDDTIVAGTDGDVSMRAFRFAQWSEGRLWNFSMRMGYVYRRDRTEFHSTERIVTHSHPPSSSRTPIATHETTISQVHEVPIGVTNQRTLGGRWAIIAGADVSPVTLARLTTILPEKYPGRDIRFQAKVATLMATAELVRQRPRWPMAISAGYGRTWSYRSGSEFDRDVFQVGIHLGLTQ
jgi:hypothetical protein